VSNRRDPRHGRTYRHEYLRSPAWYARRDRWFTTHTDPDGISHCTACGGPGTRRDLELHHLTYTGMTISRGVWIAAENDEDLISLHPYCHELLHRLIDRDPILARHRDRRTATAHALAALQRRLTMPTAVP
jgi:5-methylcytosine-specific restriction enzyme A